MSEAIYIDYIENDLVSLEWQGKQLIVPKAWLPQALTEKDTLKLELSSVNSKSQSLLFSLEVSTARKERLENLRASLKTAPSGDIEL